jgi:hypothetical protein
MRRWYAALGVVIVCLVFTIGASSSDAVAVLSGPETTKVLEAAAVVTQPTVVTTPSTRVPAPAFGSYAVVGLETLLAAAFLCYAFLQRRRSERAGYQQWLVRLRGPPRAGIAMVLAP